MTRGFPQEFAARPVPFNDNIIAPVFEKAPGSD
jgi:hypothetical protein